MDKWAALEAAKPRLLARFQDAGAERIEYTVGFVCPYQVSVWLGTATDPQKAALAGEERLAATVRDILTSSGLGETDAVFDGVVVQSQETVDRDYEGSWFYALR